jgi:hypothetical protein
MPAGSINVFPGGLQPAHYTAIGKIASNWAALELIINSVIWCLAGVDDEAGACITANIFTIDGRLKTLIALMKLRGAEQAIVTDLNRFANDSREIANKRNRIVHDPWAAEFPTGTPHHFQITADRNLVFGYKPMETSSVNEVVDEIAEFINRLTEILDGAKDLLAKWRKPLPEAST